MRLDHFFLLKIPPELSVKKSSINKSYSKTQLELLAVVLLLLSTLNITTIFITYFFPVSIAGLKLTFPSRTRLIRGLATMVLHIWVWESSSMPGFFLPKFPDQWLKLWIRIFFALKRLATMVLHIRVWESYGRGSAVFFGVCFVFSAIPLKNPQSIIKLLPCGFPSVYLKIQHNLQKNLSAPRLSLPGFFLPKFPDQWLKLWIRIFFLPWKG